MSEEVRVTIRDIMGDEESSLVARIISLMSVKFQQLQGLPPPVADAVAVQMLIDLLRGFGEWNADQDGVTVTESEIIPVKKDTLQ